MPDSPPAITDAHINRFRQRARFHFGISYAILFGILILFGFAIYIFLFAQQIDKGKGSIQILQELLVAKRDQELVVKVAEKRISKTRDGAATGDGRMRGKLLALGSRLFDPRGVETG